MYMDIKKLNSLYAIVISEESIFLSDPKFIKVQNTSGNRNRNRNKIFIIFKNDLVTAKDNVSQEKDELGTKMIYG